MSLDNVSRLRPAPLRERLREFEIVLILEALEQTRGNQMDASIVLGIPLRTLVYKIKKYDIRTRLKEREAGSSLPTRSLSA